MIFGIGNPPFESRLHEHPIDHVSYSLELVILSIARSHSYGLLPLLLRIKCIDKILGLVLKILSHHRQLDCVFLITMFFPLEEGLRKRLLV